MTMGGESIRRQWEERVYKMTMGGESIRRQWEERLIGQTKRRE